MPNNEVPEWRKREIEAEAVNRSPAVDGHEKWKCENCGLEWTSEVDPKYDRTKDRSNWPVNCGLCFTKKKTDESVSIDDLMAYEDGEMSDDDGNINPDGIKLFQQLIDTGRAWTLQGHYGRTAIQLIEAGVCKDPRKESK